MRVLNLTQHAGTPDQPELIEPGDKKMVQDSLTFDEIPDHAILNNRAKALTDYAVHQCRKHGIKSVMIGGAPFFMVYLEHHLLGANLRPLYSFSKRVSSEVTQPDGTVKKVVQFKHIGYVGTEFAEV
jgi:hypothetical protein